MLFQSLLPVFLYFAIGIALRVAGLADREHAPFIFRLVFYVTLPALAFQAISTAPLTSGATLLPIAGFGVDVICLFAAWLCLRGTEIGAAQAGAVVLGASITNMVFMFPFVIAILGPPAMSIAVLYDVGNAIFVATVAYLAALRFGAVDAGPVMQFVAKTLGSPLFIAVAAAMLVNLTGLEVPALVGAIAWPLAAATSPLILIGLGVSFSITRMRDALPLHVVLLRMLVGLLAGMLVATSLGLTGLAAVVVVASAAAPIGFNSLTLASIGRLDTEQAAAALSISVAVGLVTAPLLLVVLSRWSFP